MCCDKREETGQCALTLLGVRVVSDNGHVVTGVRIVQCYHAIMANSEQVGRHWCSHRAMLPRKHVHF